MIIIKFLIENFIIQIVRYFNFIKLKLNFNCAKFVCLPPALKRSRGDLALFWSVYSIFGTKDVRYIATGNQLPVFFPDANLQINFKYYKCFTTTMAFSEKLDFLWSLRKANELFLIGCDLLDGKYSVDRSLANLNICKIAAKTGIPVRIVGFSINNALPEQLVNEYTSMGENVTFYPREQNSYNRLKKLNIKNLQQSSDIAFLLKPNFKISLPLPIEAFINERGPKILGLNLSTHWPSPLLNSEKHITQLTGAIKRLIQDGWSILLLPHHEPDDFGQLQKIKNNLPEDSYCEVNPIPDPFIVQAITSKCQHIFTGRLHLAIIAMTSGVPCTGFPYQDKFEGIFEAAGLKDNLIYSLPDSEEEVYQTLVLNITNGLAQKTILIKNIQQLSELARSSLDSI